MARYSSQGDVASTRIGGMVPLVAFALIAILVSGGLAVEYARLQLARTELRAVADNVSRSCATELLLSDSQEKARDTGLRIASQYTVANKPFKIKNDDIVFGRFEENAFKANANPPNAVRVNSARTSDSASGAMNLIFGSVFGVKTSNIQSTATSSFRMIDLCFVLDRSSSMKLAVNSKELGLYLSDPRANAPPFKDSRWASLDRSFKLFIDELGGNAAESRVGMVSFASNFTAFGIHSPASSIDLAMSSNLANAKSTMNKLSTSVWNGNTFIEAGMRSGIQVLQDKVNTRGNAEKVMIVLTDGYQNEGDAKKSTADAVKLGITIHTITFGDFADRSLMKDIAAMGGGMYAHADNDAELKQILLDLASALTALME